MAQTCACIVRSVRFDSTAPLKGIKWLGNAGHGFGFVIFGFFVRNAVDLREGPTFGLQWADLAFMDDAEVSFVDVFAFDSNVNDAA